MYSPSKYCFVAISNKAFLIQRVRKQAFFERFCFLTSKRQALDWWWVGDKLSKNVQIDN